MAKNAYFHRAMKLVRYTYWPKNIFSPPSSILFFSFPGVFLHAESKYEVKLDEGGWSNSEKTKILKKIQFLAQKIEFSWFFKIFSKIKVLLMVPRYLIVNLYKLLALVMRLNFGQKRLFSPCNEIGQIHLLTKKHIFSTFLHLIFFIFWCILTRWI